MDASAASPQRLASPLDRSFHALTFSALEEELRSAGLKTVHAQTFWRALYRERSIETEQFPPPLRRWFRRCRDHGWALDVPRIVSDVRSSDGLTRKFLIELADGERIESVLMGYPGRHTLCLSTQAGCAMGCVFCATGQSGFSRNLDVAEIVGQVVHARRVLQRDGSGQLRNLVLMGMGEPLHNYERVMSALEIICDPRGIGLGPARVAISTVGVVPGILRLAEENRPYRLAVSLHATSNAGRLALVPASRRWPLETLIAACRDYCARTGRRIFFEWTLIDGINDSLVEAERLSALLAGMDAHVNIIPLNATHGFNGRASAPENTAAFQRRLQEAGLPATIRQRRGIDVAGGCGQLRVTPS